MAENVVSLDLFKQHVRSDDFSDDDAYMQQILKAAQESVIMATNRTYDDLVKIGNGDFPASLQQAIMLLAAHWYNQRESVSLTSMQEVPDALQTLIKPFRKLVDDEGDTDK